jgi:hypothetical protein
MKLAIFSLSSITYDTYAGLVDWLILGSENFYEMHIFKK